MNLVHNDIYNFTGICIADRIPAFKLFEEKLLLIDRASVGVKFQKLKAFAQTMNEESNVLYADVQIVLTYFEKLVALEDGMADKDLFRDINLNAFDYYQMNPHLTSQHLFEAALAAGVSLN